MRAAVLTVSDGVASGSREDTSGAVLAERAASAGFEVVERRTVADERDQIAGALEQLAALAELVLTTGGTGFAPRDVTPEATAAPAASSSIARAISSASSGTTRRSTS